MSVLATLAYRMVMQPAVLIAPAPSLSSAVDAANGPTAATGSVDTTGGDGTLYVVAIPAGDSAPSAAEVKAGQRAGGSAAEFAGSQAVVASGTQTLAGGGGRPTMLAPETGYKLAFMHESAGALQSAVVVADGFTTPALLVGEANGGGASTTNPTVASSAGVAVEIGDLIFAVNVGQTSTVTVGTVTDNLGNTYLPLGDGTVNSTIATRAYYSIATVAGTLTAVNFADTASSNDVVVEAIVYKGPFAAIDVNGTDRTDNTSSYTSNATGTLGSANVLVVTWLGGAAAGDPFTVNSPWILAGTVLSGGVRRLVIAHQNPQSTDSLTGSFDGAATGGLCVIGIASFQRAV